MSFRRPLLIVLVSLSILVSSFAAPAQKRKGRPAKPEPVIPAPVVAEINTEALIALLKPGSNKPLLVNFWATFCDPCRDEFPDLVKIDTEFRPRGLDFVTVSLDDLQDIKTKVPQFLQQMKATMPAYLLNVPDPEPAINAVDPRWQGDLPATILYTPSGEVAFKHFGRVNATELRQAIEKVINKSDE